LIAPRIEDMSDDAAMHPKGMAGESRHSIATVMERARETEPSLNRPRLIGARLHESSGVAGSHAGSGASCSDKFGS
jgi:hypothetical protein